MSLLSPRLQLKVAQKQILTPGLVQMVTVLQLNRLELREMITQEIAENPVLDESADEAGEELSPQEVQQLLESERIATPADQSILEAANGEAYSIEAGPGVEEPSDGIGSPAAAPSESVPEAAEAVEPTTAADPFDEIDFGSFFDDYLDPGYKSPVFRTGRQALVRDVSLRAGHAGRPPALAVEHGAALR